jgi:hypothetical protein
VHVIDDKVRIEERLECLSTEAGRDSEQVCIRGPYKNLCKYASSVFAHRLFHTNLV